MAKRIAVVVSQGQSANPAKRQLEEEIVSSLLFEKGIDVTVVPHLYDLKPDGTGMLALQGIKGDLVLLSWLFPRAARWILDRNDVHGHEGVSLLTGDDDEEDEDLDEEVQTDNDKERVIDHRQIPNRKIYCLDLRQHSKAAPYVEEVKRIAQETATNVVGLTDWIGGAPKPEQMERFLAPTNDLHQLSPDKNGSSNGSAKPNAPAEPNGQAKPNGAEHQPIRIEENGGRRWYPVIDFSRCTNCMECVDFCLFGVYGVDQADTILVEQPDNCRKGCPACSRVCPENAIIFPQHKTPAIAGAPGVGAGALKIDLSQLFGAPESGKTAEEIAAAERDEQLILAGRSPVGLAKRQEGREEAPKDDLDNLLDELDDLDL